MRAVDGPKLNAKDVYKKISLSRKHLQVRNRLIGAEQLIFDAYDAYLTARADVTILTPATTTPARDSDLRANYEYLNRYAQDLRTAILQNNRGGRCPLCGQGQATTLDHYLPRSIYPEYSVLPMNLIPCCYECNKRKASHYVDARGALFLHAYFDDIPCDERFLFADVQVINKAIVVRFDVQPPASLEATLGRRIVTHFERLELAAYYLSEGVNEIGERQGLLKQMLADGMGADDVCAFLKQDAASVGQDKGVNYWRYALLDAMANSGPICTGAFGH